MAKYPNDDLFESTKMSFGEHLEELRVCLFRALFGLAIGVVIGLCLAGYVVDFIQTPLRNAMEIHFIGRATKDIRTQYGLKDNETNEMVQFIEKHRVVYEDIFLETAEVNRLRTTMTDFQSAEAASAGDKTKIEPESNEKQNTAIAAKSSEATTVKSAVERSEPTTTEKSATRETKLPPKSAPTFVGGMPDKPQPIMLKTRIWRELKVAVQSLSADEAFMIWMKAGMVFGVILSSPWIFYQIWLFVAAGLYPHEKKYVNIYLPLSIGLFLAGAALAFFFVFEPVLSFLFSFNESMNIGIDARISEWLSFVLILPLGFGISFQLPLVMLFVNRIGVVKVEQYIEKWRIAILAVFVISMVLTPADPVSMLLMALPLSLLYFLGIGLCKWMPRGKNPFAESAA